MELTINNQTYEVNVPEGEPLLWVLRDALGLTGTKFGCGIGMCGVCVVHIDGQPRRSCITPASSVEGASITTIEGLATRDEDDNEVLHPVQQAFIDEQVPQCSWCMSGQMMSAAALIESNDTPTDEEIVTAMSTNYCRCGTYARIKGGVARAAQLKRERDA